MLQFTTSTGRVIQRVFCGEVRTAEDVTNLLRDISGEVMDNTTGFPLLVEVWKEATPQENRRRKHEPVAQNAS